MKMPGAIVTAAGLLLWLVAASASAHGLLISVRGDGSTVSGTVYYSNGTPGAGEWVEMYDLNRTEAPPLGANAGPDGGFDFPGVEGGRYRILVSGEEGHSVESEITLSAGARGQFVDRDAPVEQGWTWPPAWLVIGGLLLASVIPALWFRRRGKR